LNSTRSLFPLNTEGTLKEFKFDRTTF